MNFGPGFAPGPISVHIENADEKKRLFGEQLSKGLQAFEAACVVCGERTSEALYISQNWLNDPIVLKAKQNVNNSVEQLDADQYAAMLLKLANEKNQSNTFYILEGKDRVKLLELYGQARGHLGKNALTNLQQFNIRQINVKFVEPERKEEKVIDLQPSDDNLENSNNKSNVKLKLVS